MNAKEKKLLERAITIRLERLSTILAANREAQDSGPVQDESARLDELSHIPVDETLMNIAKEEQSQLMRNLEWLDSDEAGLCRECGEQIPIERLVTVPTTRYCVACAKS